jgi:hypothetical protein
MKLFVSARRHRAELAAARGEVARLRGERDVALGQRDTAVFNREQILRQLAEADATNRRVHERNLELGRRISQLTESDPEYAARLERRVARLLLVGARLLAARDAETRRADVLQGRLDDACGLNTAQIDDGRYWQHNRQDKPRVKEAS